MLNDWNIYLIEMRCNFRTINSIITELNKLFSSVLDDGWRWRWRQNLLLRIGGTKYPYRGSQALLRKFCDLNDCHRAFIWWWWWWDWWKFVKLIKSLILIRISKWYYTFPIILMSYLCCIFRCKTGSILSYNSNEKGFDKLFRFWYIWWKSILMTSCK